MTEAASELSARLRESRIDPRALCALLDAASHEQRLGAVRSLNKSAQRRLYDAVEGFRPVRLVDLVGPEVPALTPVRHFGRNTLPAFRDFEKRFCRPEGCDPVQPDHLYGFNFQAVSWLTGPGYFVARESTGATEVCIDYHEVPPVAPAGWPALRSNEQGLSRFVYGFMLDTLRRVSTHVTVGRAARKGRNMDSWFVLCQPADAASPQRGAPP